MEVDELFLEALAIRGDLLCTGGALRAVLAILGDEQCRRAAQEGRRELQGQPAFGRIEGELHRVPRDARQVDPRKDALSFSVVEDCGQAGLPNVRELEALGLTFISLRDNLDLSTPSGRLMFQIIGAMAEFERSLIQERVKAGLRNAKAKGKRLGRPRVLVDETAIFAMRDSGASWRTISGKLGIGLGTAHRIAQRRSKNLCGTFTGTLPGAAAAILSQR